MKKISYWSHKLLILISIGYLSIYPAYAELTTKINIAGFFTEITSAEQLSQSNSCKSGEINYQNYHWNRVLSDFFILCRAFYTGGVRAEFKFHSFPNQARLLVQSKQKSNLVPMLSVEFSAIDKEVYFVSSPLFEQRDIFVGVYGKEKNSELMRSKSLNDLQSFTAVTNGTWIIDKLTLEAMGVNYTTTSYFKHMFQMIDKKRADFTLISFSNSPNEGHTVNGITLVPVPNIKIQFKKSKFLTNHFIINKQAKNAEELYKRLQKGISEMKRSGEIDKIYQKTGVIDPDKDNRTIICCD